MWRSPFMPLIEWSEKAWPYTMSSQYYESILFPALGMIIVGFIISSVKDKTSALEAFGALLLLIGFGLLGGPVTFFGLILIVGIPLMVIEVILMLFDPEGRRSLASLIFLIVVLFGLLGAGGGSWIIAIFVRRR